MALSAGTRLGQYEILAPLGAGGMGEVYRATDTKLSREVAIKVLPTEVAGDAERLARFQREATLLAALNHPHIAAIYGLEEDGGSPFLVLELVEGEDLAERLKRGAIPVSEALGVAHQIAEALEEAHEKGIIHRDLKPANVKVTPEGKVKVLDFGLAKAWGGDEAPSADLSQSPTLVHSGTQAGVILGTAAYMSPEQARGKPIDKRTDIWAFGVVLYEMLSGQPLFGGETVSDVMAAVLTRDVDWSALPAETPTSVKHLLQRCLERSPRERLRDVGEARIALTPPVGGAAGRGDDGREPAATGGAPGTLPAPPSFSSLPSRRDTSCARRPLPRRPLSTLAPSFARSRSSRVSRPTRPSLQTATTSHTRRTEPVVRRFQGLLQPHSKGGRPLPDREPRRERGRLHGRLNRRARPP